MIFPTRKGARVCVGEEALNSDRKLSQATVSDGSMNLGVGSGVCRGMLSMDNWGISWRFDLEPLPIFFNTQKIYAELKPHRDHGREPSFFFT